MEKNRFDDVDPKSCGNCPHLKHLGQGFWDCDLPVEESNDCPKLPAGVIEVLDEGDPYEDDPSYDGGNEKNIGNLASRLAWAQMDELYPESN